MNSHMGVKRAQELQAKLLIFDQKMVNAQTKYDTITKAFLYLRMVEIAEQLKSSKELYPSE